MSLYQCSGCDAVWIGLTRCHCSGGCHQTFDDRASFERHRRIGPCCPAEDLGLITIPSGIGTQPSGLSAHSEPLGGRNRP